MTDSGGLQEELRRSASRCWCFGKKRSAPKRCGGHSKACGVNEDNIYNLAAQLLTDNKEYDKWQKRLIRTETVLPQTHNRGDTVSFRAGDRPEDFGVSREG